MPDYVPAVVDVFENGFNAFVRFVNEPKLFPAVPVNPYDPATHIGLYDEWECGYEYAGHLSKQPEKDRLRGPTTTKVQKLFGPFQNLLLPPPEKKE